MASNFAGTDNLRRAITRATLLPSALVWCALLVFDFWLAFAQQKDFHQLQLDQTKMQVQRYWQASLKHSGGGENDLGVYRDLSELLLTNPTIQSLVFVNAQEQEIARFGSPLRRDVRLPTALRTTERSAAQTLDSLEMPFGRLIVIMDRQPLIIAAYQFFALSAVLLCCVVLLVFWQGERLYRLLNNPLNELIARLKNIRAGRAVPLPVSMPLSIYTELQAAVDDTLTHFTSFEARLQHSVEHATAELRETLEAVEIQNIELDMARKNALQADRVKSEFLATASEEIKTPLESVVDVAQQLLRTRLSDQQQDYLSNVQQTVQGVLSLIGNLQDFSRLAADSLQLESKILPIRRLIAELLNFYAPQANERKVRLLSIVDHDLPETLVGDPSRLKQVLTTLMANAIKFSSQGDLLVEVAVIGKTDITMQLRISVTDNGVGLSEDQQSDLFNAFSASRSSGRSLREGASLGLPIAKGLVDKMNGTIGLSSRPNQGTTFWFTAVFGLPNSVRARPISKLFEDTRIMVVDEQPVSRREIVHILGGWKMTPIECVQLSEAAALSATSDVQVAIIDALDAQNRFDKPKMFELIKHMVERHTMGVIVLASASIERLIAAELMLLNVEVMTRPLQSHQLYQTLSSLLAAKSKLVSAQLPHLQRAKSRSDFINILVVDDHPANTRLVFEFLKKCRLEARVANSGAQALELFANNSFDLVLMDVQMPDMDGYETTRQLRKLEAGQKRTPIIALTAHAVNEHRSKLILAGMDDYLGKPVSFEALTEVLRKWLGADAIASNSELGMDDQPVASLIEESLDAAALFSLAESMRLAKHNSALAADLLQMLLDSLPEGAAEIERLVRAENWSELQNFAHKFYGGCCYVGVPALQLASRTLDRYLQGGATADVPVLVAQLKTQMQALLTWSENYDVASLFAD